MTNACTLGSYPLLVLHVDAKAQHSELAHELIAGYVAD